MLTRTQHQRSQSRCKRWCVCSKEDMLCFVDGDSPRPWRCPGRPRRAPSPRRRPPPSRDPCGRAWAPRAARSRACSPAATAGTRRRTCTAWRGPSVRRRERRVALWSHPNACVCGLFAVIYLLNYYSIILLFIILLFIILLFIILLFIILLFIILLFIILLIFLCCWYFEQPLVKQFPSGLIKFHLILFLLFYIVAF